ncbi:MAG: aminotransferase class V-fold PLP-dependent enzyme [Clostridia bacterium]|nr:aminotransferase class V-fold PLP-dependent enzyme [Clostridia bacterium]
MIYLDNSATSFPKPKCVIDAVNESMMMYGNYGRSSYEMALKTTEKVYNCRKKVARFFNASTERVIFTNNCTMALNMAIKGIAFNGCHFVISDLEHNAVLRPLEALKKCGICDYSIAKVERDVYKTIQNFEREIKKNTVAIICTGASNVFGIIPPYRYIGSLAHRYNLKLILDASQIAGVRKIDLKKDNIDILCCAGHKGLYGPTGIGVFVLNDDINLNTIVEGGTGSNSLSATQPELLPDRFESGTPNISGIIGLSSAMDFIEEKGVDKIYNHEISLIKYLQKNIEFSNDIIVYTNFFDKGIRRVPVFSFNVVNKPSEEVAALLSKDSICVRAGLHCAPLAHKKYNTDKIGVVRVSPSIFTKKIQIDFTINSLFKIAK